MNFELNIEYPSFGEQTVLNLKTKNTSSIQDSK